MKTSKPQDDDVALFWTKFKAETIRSAIFWGIAILVAVFVVNPYEVQRQHKLDLSKQEAQLRLEYGAHIDRLLAEHRHGIIDDFMTHSDAYTKVVLVAFGDNEPLEEKKKAKIEYKEGKVNAYNLQKARLRLYYPQLKELLAQSDTLNDEMHGYVKSNDPKWRDARTALVRKNIEITERAVELMQAHGTPAE